MTNKKNWFGILVIALVFGMTVISCGGNRLEGAQVDQWGDVLVFGRATITDVNGDNGTFATRGNNITITFSGANGNRLFSAASTTGTFSIDGNILILTTDGNRDTFTRMRQGVKNV